MGIWNNIVNGYKDTEEYVFFKRVKDTWKKANPEQRKEMIWKTARNVALFAGSFAIGSMVGGYLGVAAVAVGWGTYGVNKEYQARKQAAMHKAIKQNKGRYLTEKQKSNTKLKALVDTLGIAPVGMVAGMAVEPPSQAMNRTKQRVKSNQPQTAEPAKPLATKAFDFDFMKSQSDRKY